MFATTIGMRTMTPEEMFTHSLASEDDWSKFPKSSSSRSNSLLALDQAVQLHEDILEDMTFDVPIPTREEIVVMVEFPGAGKSTLVKKVFEPARYIIIYGNSCKTTPKILKMAASRSKDKRPMSIVFDATNPTGAKRGEYAKFAKANNYDIIRLKMCESYISVFLYIAYCQN